MSCSYDISLKLKYCELLKINTFEAEILGVVKVNETLAGSGWSVIA